MNTKRFDEAAATWDENPVRQGLTEAIARAIVASVPLRPETKTLEFGCGTGALSVLLAPHVGPIQAADTSAGMIAELRRKLARCPELTDRITPRQLDGPVGEAVDRPVDLICSAMVLHHIEDTVDTLKQLAGLLAGGGHLALADLYTEDGSFHRDEPVAHNGFDPADLVGHLAEIGLTDARFEPVHTIQRPTATGELRDYSVFLLTARRP